MSSFARTTNVTWTDTARQLPGSSDRTGTSATEAAPGPSARRQLSALDVQFLNAETATTPTHVGVLAVLDPSNTPGGRIRAADLRALLAARLHLVPALRWRLHQVPGGLDRPYWVDVAEVDLERHVREIELPRTGTDAALGELVGRLAQLPLERDAPLWQAYLLNGLSGGRQALYAKVHHAVVDGVSGAEVLAVLFDISATPTVVPRPAASPAREVPPRPAQVLRRCVRNQLGLPGTAATLLRSAPLAPTTLRPAPRTTFNEPLTIRRDFAFTSVPLAGVKAIKDALGMTVNDVVLASCSTALRGWLDERGELPDRPLVAAVPVSIRTPEQVGTAGNQISLMLTTLPTDVDDPVLRLEAMRESVAAAKRGFARRPARLLQHGSAVIPQLLHGRVTRALVRASRLAPPLFNLFVSSVPGPQLPLYAAGARVLATYPVSVVAEVGGGVNITVMSYDGHLDFGVISCPDVAPDGWRLVEHLRRALNELGELAGRAQGQRHLRVLPTG